MEVDVDRLGVTVVGIRVPIALEEGGDFRLERRQAGRREPELVIARVRDFLPFERPRPVDIEPRLVAIDECA